MRRFHHTNIRNMTNTVALSPPVSKSTRFIVCFILVMLIVFPLFTVFATSPKYAASPERSKQYVYDEAGLLEQEQLDHLQTLAQKYSTKRETDMIIVTSTNPEGEDVMKMTQDFYDEHAPGYDQPHGNAVILTVDMYHREIYLAGFYKAEQYLDDSRLDMIRNKITPFLTNGDYAKAFELFLKKAYDYMGYEPGVNPENILFKLWFQIAASLVIAGMTVGAMAYHSGGRVQVNRRTYEDPAVSGVTKRRDQYLHTTTTKRKIPRNNSRSGGGGGGGITGGGHSHSGSRGSF